MRPRELEKLVRQTTGKRKTPASRHLRSACRIIGDDETVLSVSPCSYRDKAGLLLVSHSRVFFVTSTILGSISVDEFPMSSIKYVSYQCSLFRSVLKIKADTEMISISKLSRKGIVHMTNVIRLGLNGHGFAFEDGAGDEDDESGWESPVEDLEPQTVPPTAQPEPASKARPHHHPALFEALRDA